MASVGDSAPDCELITYIASFAYANRGTKSWRKQKVMRPDREMEAVREKRVDRGKKLACLLACLLAIIACVTARIGESDKAIKRGGASTYRGIRFYLGALVTVHVNDAR